MNTVAATPQDFPVLLSLSAPWDGLLAWVEGEAAPAGGRVGAGGLAMLHRGDHPADVVRLAPLAHAAQAMAGHSVSGFRVGVPTPEP